MKKLFLLFFVFAGLFSQAQQKLYYFRSKDNWIGVKNQSGKIIIPAKFQDFIEVANDVKNRKYVEKDFRYGNWILMYPNDQKYSLTDGFGAIYNYEGNFLFTPYAFDNGSDEITEGLIRYVKNKKVGFINRMGKVVIPAQYDYVSSFDYGIAKYCIGCHWDNSKDQEHPEVVGGTWGYVNTKGEELKPSTIKQSEKDQQFDSAQYLPYQFSYTAAEQKIIDSFTSIPLISKAYFVNHSSPMDENERTLRFEIVERPSASFPYYHVKPFQFSYNQIYYGDEMLNFYVSKDRKKYYNLSYEQSLIPLDKWLKNYVQEAKDYLKDYPEALYKF